MKTTKKAHILLTAVAVALTGCATTNIVPQYVNPTNYQGHDCNLLQSEVARISQSAKATENQNTKLSATGIGIGLVGGRHLSIHQCGCRARWWHKTSQNQHPSQTLW